MFVSRIFTAWRKLNLEQALFLAAKPVFQRNSGECTRISPRFGHAAPGATRESGLTLVNDAHQLTCLPAPFEYFEWLCQCMLTHTLRSGHATSAVGGGV